MSTKQTPHNEPYRNALLTVAARVMRFGGLELQRDGPFGKGFWIDRDNVIAAIDEELAKADEVLDEPKDQG